MYPQRTLSAFCPALCTNGQKATILSVEHNRTGWSTLSTMMSRLIDTLSIDQTLLRLPPSHIDFSRSSVHRLLWTASLYRPSWWPFGISKVPNFLLHPSQSIYNHNNFGHSTRGFMLIRVFIRRSWVNACWIRSSYSPSCIPRHDDCLLHSKMTTEGRVFLTNVVGNCDDVPPYHEIIQFTQGCFDS